MKLKVRYENEMITYFLNDQETEQLWVSFDLEGEDLSQEEKERKIQDAWEVQYNRPDYNCWHKLNRHRGFSKAQSGPDDLEEEMDSTEPLMCEVADDRIFRKDEIEHERKEEYEMTCSKVRRILAKKPDWADMIIAIRINGEPVREYAERNGLNENNVTQKLKRAEKKLRESW